MSNTRRTSRRSLASLALLPVLALTGCQTLVASSTILQRSGLPEGQAREASGSVQPSPAPELPPTGLYVLGKRSSNLSDDLRTINLTVECTGKNISYQWAELGSVTGAFNASVGQAVQWTALSPGSYTTRVQVTVSDAAGRKDSAVFTIPVRNGQIVPAEMMPEVSLSPQSAILFKPLPTSLGLRGDALAGMNVKSALQLTPTTFVFDVASNRKEKTVAAYDEMKWLTDDPLVAIVDDNGVIQTADGAKTGTTAVTAISKTDASNRATCLVTVATLGTALTPSFPSATVYRRGAGSPTSLQFGATVQYSDPTQRGRVVFTDPLGREVTWSSSDLTRAQISPSGLLTALDDAATGDVQVTVTSNYDPSVSRTVTIRVL